jgi:hypothetical protein
LAVRFLVDANVQRRIGPGKREVGLGWAFGEKNFRERDGLASQKVLNQTF